MKASEPSNEQQRLDILRRHEILDTNSEQDFDDLTVLASQICGTPIAVLSLIDSERQWFKSKVGLSATQTSRDIAFCAHAILKPEEVLIIPDATRDPRFADNPLVVSDPSIRFYAGAPLVTSEGVALGTLCVIDRIPRELKDEQRRALSALSRQAMSQIELRSKVRQMERFQRLSIGRELEMVRLKAEINELSAQLHLPERYNRPDRDLGAA